jgi:hypothetical protein
LLPPQAVGSPIGDKGSLPPASTFQSPPSNILWDQGSYPPNRTVVYANVDYLLWTVRKDSYPPLVTSGSINDTPDGALGQPGTRILFGGGQEGPSTFSGGRFTVGYWFDRDQTWALEGGYFFLGQRTTTFQASHNGNSASTTSLDIPYYDGDLHGENAYQVGLPGQSGAVTVTNTLRFQGAELNLHGNLLNTDRLSVSFLAGFRYLSLEESLSLATNFEAVPPTFFVASTTAGDSFATKNNYYGGQVGLAADMNWNRFTLNAQGKVALGGMNENVTINGSTVNTNPITGTVTTPGGIFTAPSNIGSFNRTTFAVVPEVGINLGYQLTTHLTATVGYTFLYASNVVRPGDQIDRTLNFEGTRPAFSFQSSDFWAQGVNFGLQFRY